MALWPPSQQRNAGVVASQDSICSTARDRRSHTGEILGAVHKGPLATVGITRGTSWGLVCGIPDMTRTSCRSAGRPGSHRSSQMALFPATDMRPPLARRQFGDDVFGGVKTVSKDLPAGAHDDELVPSQGTYRFTFRISCTATSVACERQTGPRLNQRRCSRKCALRSVPK